MFQHLFDPQVILVTWPVILFSLTIHEFMHAWTADRLGDPTAREAGRVTLNPIAHYDLVGTTLCMVFKTYGWAKPVPVNPSNLRYPRRDDMLVSAAGPVSNLALATVFLIAFKVLQLEQFQADAASSAARTVALLRGLAAYGVFLNLILGVFNLIPLSPLDGFHILRGLVYGRVAYVLDQTRSFGFFIHFLLVFSSLSFLSEPMWFLMRILDAKLEQVVIPFL